MEVMVIPVAVGVLETVVQGLENRLEVLEIGGRIKTILTKALLKWPEY